VFSNEKKDLEFKIHCIRKLSISDFQPTARMSKRQKKAFFHFEDLPDEILLKILSLLDIKGVLQCGQVSKRLRAVSNDQSLWLKLNLFGREVPYGLIGKAVKNGCEYLNLGFSVVNGGKKSEVPWKLKYLEISQSDDLEWVMEVPKGVLENCHFLQKLAVDNLILKSEEIEQICQNGETLRILSLEGCNIQSGNIDSLQKTELIQKLFTKCPQLTELNVSKKIHSSYTCGSNILIGPYICAIVENLTPNILKLSFDHQECVHDHHVNTLVHRCNKITELDLSFTQITNVSIESIIEHLNSLEKLNIDYTNIDFSTLLRLKSIKTLKVLRCFGWDSEKDDEKIKNLKLQLPHVRINEEYFTIAYSTKKGNGSLDLDWFWDIRAMQQDCLPRAPDRYLPNCSPFVVFL
jgi:hypothetical protein